MPISTRQYQIQPSEGDEMLIGLEACRDMYGNKTAFRLEYRQRLSCRCWSPKPKILRARADTLAKMALRRQQDHVLAAHYQKCGCLH
jgi:hypothetical protein